MSRGAGIRKADLERAIAALAGAGLGVARIEVRAGGVIYVVPGEPETPAPAPPLTEPAAAAQPDDLEAWRAARGGRAY